MTTRVEEQFKLKSARESERGREMRVRAQAHAHREGRRRHEERRWWWSCRGRHDVRRKQRGLFVGVCRGRPKGNCVITLSVANQWGISFQLYTNWVPPRGPSFASVCRRVKTPFGDVVGLKCAVPATPVGRLLPLSPPPSHNRIAVFLISFFSHRGYQYQTKFRKYSPIMDFTLTVNTPKFPISLVISWAITTYLRVNSHIPAHKLPPILCR